MMKIKRVLGLVAGIGLLACSLEAKAIPFTYTDTVTPVTPIHLDSTNTSYTYLHNMLLQGFDPTTDTIGSADLFLDVRNQLSDPTPDLFNLVLDFSTTSTYSTNISGMDIVVDPSSIQNDGRLFVTLSVAPYPNSDFYFFSSTLQIAGDTNPAAVPEPGILLLIGLGLIMLTLVRTRSRRVAQ